MASAQCGDGPGTVPGTLRVAALSAGECVLRAEPAPACHRSGVRDLLGGTRATSRRETRTRLLGPCSAVLRSAGPRGCDSWDSALRGAEF